MQAEDEDTFVAESYPQVFGDTKRNKMLSEDEIRFSIYHEIPGVEFFLKGRRAILDIPVEKPVQVITGKVF